MADDTALRRFPALIREGNGISVVVSGNGYTIGADLDTLSVTPTDAAAPELLADVLARLIAHDTATALITVIDDGFYDVPGTGGTVSADDGWF